MAHPFFAQFYRFFQFKQKETNHVSLREMKQQQLALKKRLEALENFKKDGGTSTYKE